MVKRLVLASIVFSGCSVQLAGDRAALDDHLARIQKLEERADRNDRNMGVVAETLNKKQDRPAAEPTANPK